MAWIPPTQGTSMVLKILRVSITGLLVPKRGQKKENLYPSHFSVMETIEIVDLIPVSPKHPSSTNSLEFKGQGRILTKET